MKPEKQLYQWDVNQYLTGINPAAQYVDYTIGNEVIRLDTDGTRCRIPDEVLQTYGGKTCYERYPDGTFRAYSFSVLYAPKPPDYIYTPEEHTTFEALTARVDAAIEEIKRRADSGEFTPKKGVDYFTESEKNELMEGVSSGAVGEFRNVVDTATAEYNDNHNSKLAEYNANASEKLTTYDTNAEQHTTDYNRNAEVKLEAYNQNHAAKVAEYNQNAETKKAEFDSNAAALQTEVDRLRGECDTLAAENRKQENRIDALIKLNKGQTYDILPEEGETAIRTAPSGAKYVSVDKVGGKSLVWNQLINGDGHSPTITFVNGKFTYSDFASGTLVLNKNLTLVSGHKYYAKASKPFDNVYVLCYTYDGAHGLIDLGGINKTGVVLDTIVTCNYTASNYRLYVNRYGATSDTPVSNFEGYVMLFDITQMLGSTIADYIYSLEQANAGAGVAWFKQMFPTNYYPYSEPTIISSQTDRVDTVGFNQWDEEWEVGSYDSDGLPIASTDKIRTKNKISVQPSTAYYFRNGGSGNIIIFWYDDNDTVVRYEGTGNAVKTSPANAKYLRFRTNKYGTTYNNDICINLSDPSRNGEYEPYSLQQIPTNFPVLNSAGSVYDYIDLNEGKLHQRVGVVDLGTFYWDVFTYGEATVFRSYDYTGKKPSESTFVANIICSDYESVSANDLYSLNKDKAIAVHNGSVGLMINDSTYTDATAFKESMNGVMLYYELAEEVITDIDIPTELTEWLPVEAGGTVTFRNIDDTKQLPVPNAVSWVRKLDEVN